MHSAGGVLDVHLMIERPAEQVDFFAGAGADCITIHLEADPHAHRTLAAIRDAGCLAGLAINPGTPADAVAGLAAECDLLLAMSVNPGWGGQSFIASSLTKLARLRELAPDGCAVEVDGGVDVNTAPQGRRGRRRPARGGLGRLRRPGPGSRLPAHRRSRGRRVAGSGAGHTASLR